MTVRTYYFFYGNWIDWEGVLDMIKELPIYDEYLKVKDDVDELDEFQNDNFRRERGFETNETEYDGVKMYIRQPTHDSFHSDEFLVGIYLGEYDQKRDYPDELAHLLNEIYMKTIPKYAACCKRELFIITDDCACCS